MGCDDESATDEEQAEKILYYYPENEHLNDQLNKINMVEGLIDFATKFSIDAISTVVMQQNTWAFYECEKNIWVIIAVDSQSLGESSPEDFTHSHQANTFALEMSLRNLYSVYYTTHGALQSQLGNSEVDSIQRVKTLRKQIRKLRLRLRQELQDLQSLVNRENEALTIEEEGHDGAQVEHMGIRANTKTILQVQSEIDASNAEIEDLGEQLTAALQSEHYTPVAVRGSVGRFMRWYMSSGELDSHTCLSGMKGLRFLQTGYTDPVVTTVNNCTISTAPTTPGATTPSGPYNASSYHNTSTANGGGVGQSILSGHTTSSEGSAFSSTVLRIRSVIEQATAHKAIGSLVLYDGRVLWSDLDNTTTHNITTLVTLQDVLSVRTAAVRMVANPNSVMDTKNTNNSANMYFKKTGNPDADLEAAVQRQLGQLLTLRGFVTRQWGTLNLEECTINPLLVEPAPYSSVSTDANDGGTSGAGAVNGRRISGRGVVNIDVTEVACLGVSGIYCPRIYAHSTGTTSSSAISGSGGTSGECIGRAVFYRHNRAMVVILLPDWSDSVGTTTAITSSIADTTTTTNTTSTLFEYKRSTIHRILTDIHANHRTTRNMYITDYIDVINKYELSAYYSGGMYGTSASNASSVSSIVDSSVIDSTSNNTTTTENNNTSNTTNIDTTPTATAISDAALNNACIVSMCCSVQLQVSAECAKLEKAFKNITYSDETGAILSGTNTATDSASSGGSSTNSVGGAGIAGGGVGGAAAGVSAAAAYERIASAITIAEELQLGYTRPELPLSPALRNVRFVYYNPVDCSLKVCGINSSDLSPMLCAPRHFREYVIANISTTGKPIPTSHYANTTSGAGVSGGTGGGSGGGGSKGKKVAGVVVDKLCDRAGYKFPASSSLLADCLEPAVVRALNDIWVELAGRELATPTTLCTPVLEACLRVSTPQRGGVWVTGRNIGGRFLYMVIDKCVTMNDMYHAYEQLCDLLVR